MRQKGRKDAQKLTGNPEAAAQLVSGRMDLGQPLVLAHLPVPIIASPLCSAYLLCSAPQLLPSLYFLITSVPVWPHNSHPISIFLAQ